MHNLLWRKALAQAKHCDVKLTTVVAVVSLDDRPLFAVTNRRGKGSISKWTRHAEEMAVRRLSRWYSGNRVDDLELHVIRFRNNGTVGMAKPCPGCNSLVTKVFSKVYYTNNSGFFERLF